MIQLKTLDDQIQEALNYWGSDIWRTHDDAQRAKKKRQYTSLLKRLVPIRDFMKDGLTEDYLKRDKERIENRLQLLNDAFPQWHKESGIKDYFAAKKEYEKLNDYTTLKRHLSNINYILTN